MNLKEKVWAKYQEMEHKYEDFDDKLIEFALKETPGEIMSIINRFEHGCHIADKEFYKQAVNYLKWVDEVSHGPKWEVENIVKLSGIDFSKKKYTEYDYAYVVNMLYSDYCTLFTEPSHYLKMSKLYLEDPDYMGDPSERAYKNAKERIEYFQNK